MVFVVLAERVEHLALDFVADVRRSVEVEDRNAFATHNHALIGRWHVAALPVLGSADRSTVMVQHHHKSRQVFVNGSQSIVDPGTKTRSAGLNLAGVHLQHR